MLNILRPSPRTLLNDTDYENCNKQAKNYCEFLFKTFDDQLVKFLDLKLINKKRNSLFETPSDVCPASFPYAYFNGDWCCSDNKEKAEPISQKWAKEWGIKAGECDGSALSLTSKCCEGTAKRCKSPPCKEFTTKNRRTTRDTESQFIHEIKLDHARSIPNSTIVATEDKPTRERRAIPVVAQFGVVIAIAISAYFLGESIVENDLNNMKNEILAQEKSLKSLTSAVELDHSTLSSVIHQLRISPDLILAPNVTSVPITYQYMKALIKESSKFERYYADHISEFCESEAKTIELNILQLQNNRLPLDRNFLVAVRAKCLSLQKIEKTLAHEFCNDLAFHATRWDTGLKFLAVGFETNKKGDTTATVYSLALDIPILHDGGLPEFSIINIGRFQSENLIRKIALPSKAVIT